MTDEPRDHELADADQTAANSDQRVSGLDQASSDADATIAALDQRASDTDQAVADQHHEALAEVTSADQEEYEASTKIRAVVSALATRIVRTGPEALGTARAQPVSAAATRPPVTSAAWPMTRPRTTTLRRKRA
jgi:hypothetical protein